MFEKLVESNTAEAQFSPRGKFFFVSSVVVGLLFVTAVVASIYAADYGLGTENLEIADLLTPIAQTEPVEITVEPERPQRDSAVSELPERQVPMASTSDTRNVPDAISTAVNPYRSIPDSGRYRITDRYTNGYIPEGSASNGQGQTGSGPTSSSQGFTDRSGDTAPKAPPPVKRKPQMQSKGVINGEARSLPKPPYPPAAVALHISGFLSVQVVIDEQGSVISARAIDGNPILQKAAESAARRAKFSTTYLSEVPVKVTGVIVYNFTR